MSDFYYPPVTETQQAVTTQNAVPRGMAGTGRMPDTGSMAITAGASDVDHDDLVELARNAHEVADRGRPAPGHPDRRTACGGVAAGFRVTAMSRQGWYVLEAVG